MFTRFKDFLVPSVFDDDEKMQQINVSKIMGLLALATVVMPIVIVITVLQSPFISLIPIGATIFLLYFIWRNFNAIINQVYRINQAEYNTAERQKAEQALRESEEQFRQVITSISDHIYVTEITKDGQHNNLYISPNVEELTGYPLEKFVTDRNFWPSVVIHPDDRAAAANQSARLDIGQHSDMEYRMVRADGQTIWVRDSARVVNEGGSKVSYGIVSDITEYKQLEEQLRQSQKMEAVGQLAGGVAHDFNNILTVITGICDLIMFDIKADHPLHKDITEIKKASNQATSLIHQLLAFSRQQILQPDVLSFNQITTNMEGILRRLISEDIDLVVITDPQLGYIKADPSQIEQIILNLVLNARDAMPQGGKVTIETKNIYLDDTYTRKHLNVKSGSYVMLAVSDTGIGMDEETKTRIFEPFFTTKDLGKGTGLGLATVHGIVKQSNGHIWIYSEPGQGTTFKVYLPQVENTGEAVTLDKIFTDTYIGTETILLVEDEETVRELAQRILLRCGYTVLEAQNGAEAIQVSEAYDGQIDLLLTDVVMPGGMNGRQLAEHIILQRPDIKILYTSGYTDNAIVHFGVLDSEVAFLQKPFSPDTLVGKVHTVLSV